MHQPRGRNPGLSARELEVMPEVANGCTSPSNLAQPPASDDQSGAHGAGVAAAAAPAAAGAMQKPHFPYP